MKTMLPSRNQQLAPIFRVKQRRTLIIVLSFMLIPWGLHEVGGIAGMRQCLRPEFFQLYNQFSQIDLAMIAMLIWA
jgi:hypothetical protein